MKIEKRDPAMIPELREWIRNEAIGLGDKQAQFLMAMLQMVEVLLRNKTTQKQAIETLRQLMGILPKSERGKSDKFDFKPSEPSEPNAQTELESEIKNLILKHRRLYGSSNERHKQAKARRKQRSQSRNGGEEVLYNATARAAATFEDALAVNREDNFNKTTGLRSASEKHKRYDLQVVPTSAVQFI